MVYFIDVEDNLYKLGRLLVSLGGKGGLGAYLLNGRAIFLRLLTIFSEAGYILFFSVNVAG